MPAISRPNSQVISSQVISFVLVALLHALILFAVLHFMVTAPRPAIATAPEQLLETIINTASKPVPMMPAPPPPRPAPASPRRAGVTSGPMPSYAQPVAPPDLRGFGQALFGCAPENLTNLTPDQRAHCPNVFTRPDEHALVEPKSQVQDPARRAAEMRAQNTPGRVPCTYVSNAPAPHGSAPAAMFNPICLLGGLINGFRPLNGLDK